MDGTRTRNQNHPPEEPDASALAFAAFVLAHEGCDAGTEELRLDDDVLASRCRWCGEVQVFGR